MRTYLVGGAVRDKLLHRDAKDRDWVIVGARGDDVDRMIAEGYTQVGADFPVFLHPTSGEEYALARIERKVSAGYHGFVVEADASVTIEDDLARRDLTINSMAMDDAGNIIDPFHGRADLHNRVLRHTTDAFAEDPLRVLRLARFSARYKDFHVAPETIALCQKIGAAGELNALSIERIWTELAKGFSEQHPVRMFEILHETKALDYCQVLQRTFGSQLNDWQRRKLRAVELIKGEETRFHVGVVAAAKRYGIGEAPYADGTPRGDALQGAPKRMMDLYENMHWFLHTQKTAESLAGLLKKSGALREGSSFHDLIWIAMVLEQADPRDTRIPFTARELEIAAQQMRGVRAVDFPELQGKELGQAIDAKRVKALQMAMAIPMVDNQQQQG